MHYNIQELENMNKAIFTVDTSLYTKNSVIKACIPFLDSHYVKLDIDKQDYTIEIVTKEETDAFDTEKIIGEFNNILLSTEALSTISDETVKIKETIVGKAIIHAIGVQPLVSEMIFEEEEEDEDLDEVALPWEEKQNKE
jgi:His-Xaa-Ser system protein HxsD